MMSSDNTPAKKPADDTQQGGGGGGSGNSRKTTSSKAPPEQALKCPRCDSPNTKFCYYNNYSLTQPRHFCKTCRRYWTKGGALRNVPIGGGCRKNKRVRSSSSRLSCSLDSKDSGDSASDHMGLKFFHGISPAMDFQLGGLSLPRLNHHPSSSSAVVTTLYNNNNSQFSPYGDVSITSGLTLDHSGGASGNSSFMGFNYPLTLGSGSGGGVGFQQNNMNSSMSVHSSLASSIESLSSINQDLHWKLQQQRLSMLFGTTIAGDSQTQPSQKDMQMNDLEKTQTAPILFQNLEISKPKESTGGGDTAATEWFFGNSYAPPPPVTPTPTNSGGNGGGNENNAGNWNTHGVVQAWGDLQQYNALP